MWERTNQKTWQPYKNDLNFLDSSHSDTLLLKVSVKSKNYDACVAKINNKLSTSLISSGIIDERQ